MKKLLAFTLIFLLSSVCLLAQTLKGRVIDAGNNQPVEFANVGILHRDAGTVANEQGYFQLNFPRTNATDTLKVSMVGYESLALTLSSSFEKLLAQQNGLIRLVPQTRSLQEVVIKPRKTKTLITGNTTDTRFLSAGFTSNDLGSEVGTVMRYHKKKPGKLENVNFNIAYNSFPERLLFRVNIYDFKDGKIGESLTQEPLYLETNINNGTLTLDLSEKGIYLKNDCFVSLEWIKDFGKSGLMFSAGFFNSDSYARKISQGDWYKVPAGLGFWSTVVHEI